MESDRRKAISEKLRKYWQTEEGMERRRNWHQRTKGDNPVTNFEFSETDDPKRYRREYQRLYRARRKHYYTCIQQYGRLKEKYPDLEEHISWMNFYRRYAGWNMLDIRMDVAKHMEPDFGEWKE